MLQVEVTNDPAKQKHQRDHEGDLPKDHQDATEAADQSAHRDRISVTPAFLRLRRFQHPDMHCGSDSKGQPNHEIRDKQFGNQIRGIKIHEGFSLTDSGQKYQ